MKKNMSQLGRKFSFIEGSLGALFSFYFVYLAVENFFAKENIIQTAFGLTLSAALFFISCSMIRDGLKR